MLRFKLIQLQLINLSKLILLPQRQQLEELDLEPQPLLMLVLKPFPLVIIEQLDQQLLIGLAFMPTSLV